MRREVKVKWSNWTDYHKQELKGELQLRVWAEFDHVFVDVNAFLVQF